MLFTGHQPRDTEPHAACLHLSDAVHRCLCTESMSSFKVAHQVENRTDDAFVFCTYTAARSLQCVKWRDCGCTEL